MVEIVNVPATLSNEVANLLKRTQLANPLLKYKKGKWYIGEDEVALGREYIAFPTQWTVGWQKWVDKQKVAEELGKAAEGYVPKEREELDDIEKKGEDDPWCPVNFLPLEDAETGDFVVFTSSSFGGSLAIQRVVNRYSREIANGKNLGNPIVKLDTYDRRTREYGMIPTPRLEIVGWENDDIPPPPIGEEMNDAIPDHL
jgi:hypothetical protein